MEPIKFLAQVFLVFSTSTLTSQAAPINNWQPLNQGIMNVGHITAIAFNGREPQEIFTAAENDGLYQSVDSAKNWTKLSSEVFGGSDITSILVDSRNASNLYVSTSASGVYNSQDHGRTWNKILNKPVNFLEMDVQNPKTLYALVRMGGVWKTIDGGKKWQRIDQAIGKQFDYLQIKVDPLNSLHLLLITLDRGHFNPHLYQSLDGGNTWALIDTSDPDVGFYRAYFSITNAQQLFAVGMGGAYRSDDLGKTWTNIFTPKNKVDMAFAFLMDPIHLNDLYVYVEHEGLYKSNNAGKTWQLLSSQHRNDEWTQLTFDPTHQFIYQTTDAEGLWRSHDEGLTWENASRGIVNLDVISIAASTNSLYMGTTKHGLWILKNGEAWQQPVDKQFTNMTINKIIIDPLNVSHMLMNVSEDETNIYTHIYYSNDAGDTWKKSAVTENKPHEFIPMDVVFNPQKTSELLSGTYDGEIWKSMDGGMNWQKYSRLSEDIFIHDVVQLLINPKNPQEIYAGVNSLSAQVIFKSKNGGKTWEKLPYNFGSNRNINAVQALAMDVKNNIVYAAVQLNQTNAHLYKSLDGGMNWAQIDTGLPEVSKITRIVVDPMHSKTLFISTSHYDNEISEGVYFSTDGGTKWVSLNDGGLNKNISSLILLSEKNTLLAGTHGSGVFKRVLS